MFYVMAILGCGDLGEACRTARTLPVRYASLEQCIAATAERIGVNSDMDYPVINAECRKSGAAPAIRLATSGR